MDRGITGDVARATARFVAVAKGHGGRVGVVVLDAANGALLASHRAEEGFLPASNGKVPTAAVALHTLGPDHRFATELWQTGEVVDGVLHGDLLLRGLGDPTFDTEFEGAPRMREFVAAARAAGITSVQGSVVGDGTWLGDEHLGRGWQWDHLREDFAAPFGGLCCRGNVDAGVPVRDPAAFAASLFAKELGAGFRAGTAPLVAASTTQRLLLRLESPPLAALLPRMLGDSDNLYAEQMWRVAARVAAGVGDSGMAAMHAHLTLQGLGVDACGLVMEDGSGLSRRNLVRPSHVAQTLLAMHRSPHRAVFADALPLAGVSGTLRERFLDGPAHGRVRAKTGSIARVVSLSGYVPRADANAPPFVFSVLWNDFTGSDEAALAAIDAFVQDVAGAVKR